MYGYGVDQPCSPHVVRAARLCYNKEPFAALRLTELAATYHRIRSRPRHS